MEQTSVIGQTVIGQIFEKYFVALGDKLDKEIIERLKEVFVRKSLTETDLNEFIKWLEDHNAKDKKS
jgi:Mg/Co/Ni transporter MgtE